MYQQEWRCSTVTCAIYKLATAGVQTTESLVRRYLDVRTTSFFVTFPSAGKKCIAVLLREKHCESTKTVGTVKVELLRGFAGRFVLGGQPAGAEEAFCSSQSKFPAANRWKRQSQA